MVPDVYFRGWIVCLFAPVKLLFDAQRTKSSARRVNADLLLSCYSARTLLALYEWINGIVCRCRRFRRAWTWCRTAGLWCRRRNDFAANLFTPAFWACCRGRCCCPALLCAICFTTSVSSGLHPAVISRHLQSWSRGRWSSCSALGFEFEYPDFFVFGRAARPWPRPSRHQRTALPNNRRPRRVRPALFQLDFVSGWLSSDRLWSIRPRLSCAAGSHFDYRWHHLHTSQCFRFPLNEHAISGALQKLNYNEHQLYFTIFKTLWGQGTGSGDRVQGKCDMFCIRCMVVTRLTSLLKSLFCQIQRQ